MNSMLNKTQILNHQQIEQKITRIAFQIYEDNYTEKKLIIAGIANNGFIFAKLLANQLKTISNIEIVLEELHIDKKNPISNQTKLDLEAKDFKDQVIIVVDDVLNSGKTMMYGIKHFLIAPVKKLSTAVLVNRSYKRFPVHADYLGMNLATTMKERIEVTFEKENSSAFLI
jgi:pyrimidine operon attenuation protein/uracil phosphoribosyltransferase